MSLFIEPSRKSQCVIDGGFPPHTYSCVECTRARTIFPYLEFWAKIRNTTRQVLEQRDRLGALATATITVVIRDFTSGGDMSVSIVGDAFSRLTIVQNDNAALNLMTVFAAGGYRYSDEYNYHLVRNGVRLSGVVRAARYTLTANRADITNPETTLAVVVQDDGGHAFAPNLITRSVVITVVNDNYINNVNWTAAAATIRANAAVDGRIITRLVPEVSSLAFSFSALSEFGSRFRIAPDGIVWQLLPVVNAGTVLLTARMLRNDRESRGVVSIIVLQPDVSITYRSVRDDGNYGYVGTQTTIGNVSYLIPANAGSVRATAHAIVDLGATLHNNGALQINTFRFIESGRYAITIIADDDSAASAPGTAIIIVSVAPAPRALPRNTAELVVMPDSTTLWTRRFWSGGFAPYSYSVLLAPIGSDYPPANSAQLPDILQNVPATVQSTLRYILQLQDKLQSRATADIRVYVNPANTIPEVSIIQTAFYANSAHSAAVQITTEASGGARLDAALADSPPVLDPRVRVENNTVMLGNLQERLHTLISRYSIANIAPFLHTMTVIAGLPPRFSQARTDITLTVNRPLPSVNLLAYLQDGIAPFRLEYTNDIRAVLFNVPDLNVGLDATTTFDYDDVVLFTVDANTPLLPKHAATITSYVAFSQLYDVINSTVNFAYNLHIHPEPISIAITAASGRLPLFVDATAAIFGVRGGNTIDATGALYDYRILLPSADDILQPSADVRVSVRDFAIVASAPSARTLRITLIADDDSDARTDSATVAITLRFARGLIVAAPQTPLTVTTHYANGAVIATLAPSGDALPPFSFDIDGSVLQASQVASAAVAVSIGGRAGESDSHKVRRWHLWYYRRERRISRQ